MKELLKQSGIYQIRNLVNGKIYVGSAKVLKNRRWLHLGHLARVTHHCQPLQRAYAKYGKASFSFEPLITCAPSMLIWYEQQFIDKLQPEYNVCKVAGNCAGTKRSDETKKRLSDNKKKYYETDSNRDTVRKNGRERGDLFRHTSKEGITHTITEWAELSGLGQDTIRQRLKAGWDIDKIITTPTQKAYIEFNGEYKLLTEWAKQFNIKECTLAQRLNKGWGMLKATKTPVRPVRWNV